MTARPAATAGRAELPVLSFVDRAELRSWLERHHSVLVRDLGAHREGGQRRAEHPVRGRARRGQPQVLAVGLRHATSWCPRTTAATSISSTGPRKPNDDRHEHAAHAQDRFGPDDGSAYGSDAWEPASTVQG